MTEQPNELTEIRKLIAETLDKIDTVRDELLEAIDDQAKETAAQIQQVAAFQKNVLEPNQQKIWTDGIGAILTKIADIETQEQEQNPP